MGLLFRILRTERKTRLLLVLTIVFMVLESVAQMVPIYLQKDLINTVFVEGNYAPFFRILALMGLGFLVHILLFAVSPYIAHRNQTVIEQAFTRGLMKAIYRLPMALFNKERLAKFVQDFSNEVPNAAALLALHIPRFIQLAFGVGILAYLYYQADLVILAMLVVVSVLQAAIGNHYTRQSMKQYESVREKRANLLVHLEDCIGGTREIIAFDRHAWEKSRFLRLFGQMYEAARKEWRINNRGLVAGDSVKWLAIVGLIGYGAYLVLSGSMSVGEFVMLFLFASLMMDNIQLLFQTTLGLSRNFASVRRISEVWTVEQKTAGRKLSGPVSRIELRNVRFGYGDRDEPLLKGVSVAITAGQKVAFVGASGSGKTTLVHLLTRGYRPTGGEILVNGIPLEELDLKDWYEKIAVVFQDSYFFPDTIRNNLTLGRANVSEEELIRACKAACIHDFILTLEQGYDTVIGERGITLSGGQRQRLAIARALLRNPEVLILDEATSSLDPETEKAVQANIDALGTNRITICIAHRLSTVRNCSAIFVLHEGEIKETGTHEELIGKDTEYRKLYLAGEAG